MKIHKATMAVFHLFLIAKHHMTQITLKLQKPINKNMKTKLEELKEAHLTINE